MFNSRTQNTRPRTEDFANEDAKIGAQIMHQSIFFQFGDTSSCLLGLFGTHILGNLGRVFLIFSIFSLFRMYF